MESTITRHIEITLGVCGDKARTVRRVQAILKDRQRFDFTLTSIFTPASRSQRGIVVTTTAGVDMLLAIDEEQFSFATKLQSSIRNPRR